MRVAVDLPLAREDEAPGEPGLGVGAALVDMGRNDADRADLAGSGHVDAIGRRGDRIGRRQRILVRDGPERLAGARLERADLLDQIEQTADLAAGRVDVEDDAADQWIGHRGFDRIADVAVGEKPARGIEVARPRDERSRPPRRPRCPRPSSRSARAGSGSVSRGRRAPPVKRGASTPRITSSLPRAIISGVPNTRAAT